MGIGSCGPVREVEGLYWWLVLVYGALFFAFEGRRGKREGATHEDDRVLRDGHVGLFPVNAVLH